jgi:hypothetical protein
MSRTEWISSAEVGMLGWRDGDYLFVKDIEDKMRLKKYKIIEVYGHEQGYFCQEIINTN